MVLETLVVERPVVRMVIGSPSPGRQVGGGSGGSSRSRCRCVVMVMVGGIGAETTRSCRISTTTIHLSIGKISESQKLLVHLQLVSSSSFLKNTFFN